MAEQDFSASFSAPSLPFLQAPGKRHPPRNRTPPHVRQPPASATCWGPVVCGEEGCVYISLSVAFPTECGSSRVRRLRPSHPLGWLRGLPWALPSGLAPVHLKSIARAPGADTWSEQRGGASLLRCTPSRTSRCGRSRWPPSAALPSTALPPWPPEPVSFSR